MFKGFIFTAILCVACTIANAQTYGVDVQVNEGGLAPSVTQLQATLDTNDFVRDVLGWHKADPSCDLAANASKSITIPTAQLALYKAVAQANGKNFVTLAYNNVNCGQKSNSGGATFPNTDALRKEFAAYAVGVVKAVPQLGGISIWNEINGGTDGGYATIDAKMIAYCQLSNAVITAVRKVNPTLPIAIGATVGWNIDGFFIHLFGEWGCIGKNDPKIWLDVHPYLVGKIGPPSGKTDWQLWNDKIANIRAAGVTNALFATEWGGPAAHKWMLQNPNGNYMQEFNRQVLTHDTHWAGLTYYEEMFDYQNPNAGIIDHNGVNLTQLGDQYVASIGK